MNETERLEKFKKFIDDEDKFQDPEISFERYIDKTIRFKNKIDGSDSQYKIYRDNKENLYSKSIKYETLGIVDRSDFIGDSYL